MKNIFIVLFLFTLVVQKINAQKSTNDDTNVYNFSGVDKKPEFPGGLNEFYKYIGENYALPLDKEFKGGTIIATFVVEKDGSVADVKVLRDPGFGTADEAIRVLKLSPLWIPAELEGKKVRVLFSIPIKLQAPPIVEEVDDNKIYSSTEVEILPGFSGGLINFYNFVRDNFRAPTKAGLKGKVFVNFTIEKDGTLSEIKVLSDEVGNGASNEAIRVVKKSPKWIAGKINGKEVRCSFLLPIYIETPL